MRSLLPFLLVCFATVPLQRTPKCPIDDGNLRNTYESKMENGRMFYKWVCNYNSNHEYWIRSN